MNRQMLALGLAGMAAVAIGAQFVGVEDTHTPAGAGGTLADVTVPRLSSPALVGQAAFDANCAKCHGLNGAGVDGAGPPLVHIIYEPGHHGDPAFHLAVRQGVRAHHWRFGDMPALPHVSEGEVAGIVTYIRELQRANGIN